MRVVNKTEPKNTDWPQAYFLDSDHSPLKSWTVQVFDASLSIIQMLHCDKPKTSRLPCARI